MRLKATEVADHLVRANLAGHDSHGVGMLPSMSDYWATACWSPTKRRKPCSMPVRCW